MRLPDEVTIVEVGPRDGLQNEPETVPTEIKIGLIQQLADCGLPVVEVTSFVHPRWVPQLADAADVLAGLTRRLGVRYPVLVPNETGLDRALEAGVEEVAVFGAASEAFSQANLNRSIAESLEMFAPVVRRARDHGLRVRVYVSCVCGCPYQGEVPVDDAVRVTASLFELGVDEVSVGDTIGVGSPGQVAELVGVLGDHVLLDRVAVHMHDTYGQGLANTLAAFGEGVTIADASAGGLGGCPFAPGATGNLATEDLVYACEGSGVRTGVDLEALIDTTDWIHRHLERAPASRVARAAIAKRRTTDHG